MTRIWIAPNTNLRESPRSESPGNILASTNNKYTAYDAVREGDYWRIESPMYVRADRVSELRPMRWYTQLGIGRRNACGPACVAMMADFATGQEQSVVALSKAFDPGQDGTTSQDLERAAASRGVAIETLAIRDARPLSKLPAICLVRYIFDRADTYYDSFTGLHWLVLLAYDNDHVVVHDPLFPAEAGENGGGLRRYKFSEWQRAFEAINGARWALSFETPAPSGLISRFASALKRSPVSPRSDDPEKELITA